MVYGEREQSVTAQVMTAHLATVQVVISRLPII